MNRFLSVCETCVSAGIRAYIELLAFGELRRSRLLLNDVLTLSTAISGGPSARVGRLPDGIRRAVAESGPPATGPEFQRWRHCSPLPPGLERLPATRSRPAHRRAAEAMASLMMPSRRVDVAEAELSPGARSFTTLSDLRWRTPPADPHRLAEENSTD